VGALRFASPFHSAPVSRFDRVRHSELSHSVGHWGERILHRRPAIFNQRENPVLKPTEGRLKSGRESRPLRAATAVDGPAGTPTETANSPANVGFGRVTPHPSADERWIWTALHPCLRCAGSPGDGLPPIRREPRRDRTVRFDRLRESRVEKPCGDDSLADGSARDSATRRSRPRVGTRPADAGRNGLETEPDDRVPRCGRESPPVTAGEDVTYGRLPLRERSAYCLKYVVPARTGDRFAPSSTGG